MRFAAFTMIYGEYNMLDIWYHHYGKLVGYDNLYIVSHGGDPKHKEIAPRANVINIPRDRLEVFEAIRQPALVDLQFFLGSYYDVVLRTDTDEIVFYDPTKYQSLEACLMSKPGTDAWFAIGFEVVEVEDDPAFDFSRPVTEQRTICATQHAYSKAVAAGRNAALMRHGAISRNGTKSNNFAFVDGLYLAHLRMAFLDERRKTLRELQEIPQDTVDGVPPPAVGYWQSGEAFIEKFYNKFNRLSEVDADTELSEAYAFFSTGFREKHDILYTAQTPYKASGWFKLPERLIGCF